MSGLIEHQGLGLAISWLGHATVLIEVDGVRVLTDPLLRSRVGPLVRTAPKVEIERIGRLDGVLLSHLHADHTDPASLRMLSRNVPILAPAPAAGWLRRRGMQDVRELAPGEQAMLNGVRVTAVTAKHARRRTPFGPAADPIGYLVSGARSVYFAGDTDLFPEMSELRAMTDVALLPVSGWGPRVGPGHLDPARAAQAAGLICPQVAIPIHWGTLTRGWSPKRVESAEQPAREFSSRASVCAPTVTVRLLKPGERTQLWSGLGRRLF